MKNKSLQGLIIGFIVGFMIPIVGSQVEGLSLDTLAITVSVLTGGVLGVIGMFIGKNFENKD